MARLNSKAALELAVTAVLGSGLLTCTEWLLFSSRHLGRLQGTGLKLSLAVLMVSHWFLMVLACALLLRGADYLKTLVAPRPLRTRLLVGVPGLLLPLLYGVFLSLYTFSGQEAQQLWYRPLALVVMPLVVCGVLSLPFVAYVFHAGSRLWSIATLPACAVGAVGALVLNKKLLPEEYEPLHVLLSITALLYATYVGATVARWVPLPPIRWFGQVTLGSTAALSLVCTLAFGRSSRLSYSAYGVAVGARFLTVDLAPSERGDENSKGALTRASLARDEEEAAQRREERARTPAPHIIVVSIDNIQSSRVGAYGYTARPTTPNIDALARGGMVFERTYSSFPRTRVFLSSMLTGRMLPPFTEHVMPARYRETSLTRLMKARGYRVLLRGWFDAAFQFKPDGYGVDTWMPPSAEAAGQAKSRLPYVPMRKVYATVRDHFKAAVEAREPTLTWMHFLRPHPVPGGFLGEEKVGFGDSISADYDSAVAVADGYLRRLQRLAKGHLTDGRPVYWVIMSDHGAGFSTAPGTDEFDPDRTVAERHVRVPLIISGPGIAPGRSQVLVTSAVDTAATLLDLAGITPPSDYDGMSLTPLLLGYGDVDKVRSRAIHLRYYSWNAVVRGAYKGTNYRGVASLTNLAEDPRETTNIADQNEALTMELSAIAKRETLRIARAHATQ